MSKTSFTILLFAITIFLGFYSMYRVSQPRILSESEMLVNGFVEYGEYEELRDFKLTDHNGNEFTNENLKQNKLNFLYFGYTCLLYTSPSPRDQRGSRMPSSA